MDKEPINHELALFGYEEIVCFITTGPFDERSRRVSNPATRRV